ncbi:TonB-dependent receptor [Bacteroides graminisolvens]|uniref:SusC/RagA family TonB-linked outer membrane protein n=1 Tax=Bacteroides graminisolvens TaxID=477666 RepID=UPI0029C6B281|nr:TonB-dependent receptor [Bacteroides graminisolvens]
MKQKNEKLRSKLLLLFVLLLMVPIGVFAQNMTVKGSVVDSQGEPIIGASVVEKGNNSNGVITDLEGQFSLTLRKGKRVVISYVGMETQEVDAVAGKTLKVILKDDSQAIEEIVVIGYGSKARKDLTGSVGSISGAKLAAVPVTSAAVALQGKIAGVQVTTVDGAPGADINIRVRGGTSVTQSNEPLYIVDGFQTDNINDIPPADIASIDVLKDASLTAIYGAKGGNGVVVVTTKSAQQGKVSVGFNAQMSISKLAKKLDLMDTSDFVRYQYDWAAANGTRSSNAKYYRANFGNPLDLDIYQRATTRDWQDEVMSETPFNYSTNFTVGGGTEKFRFNASLTNSEDNGIIMGSGVRRTNLNIKMNIQLTRNLTLTINPRLTYRRDTGAGGDKIGSGGIIDVLRYRPTNGLREFAFWDPATVDPDDEAVFEYTNPKSDIDQNTLKKHSYAYTNQFSLDWKPIEGLTLRTEGAHFISFNDENRFYGAMTDEGQNNKKLPVAAITDKRTEKYTWTNTASYGFDIDNLHNFSFLLGQEIQHNQTKQSFIKNRYFPRSISADRALNNMGLGTPWESTSSLSTPERTASFFGQTSYNYDHKYLASITFRADGSTKFSPGEQWGYFPSISGAWVLSKESFLENNPIISNLKLRAAIGLAGNNRIDNDMWRYLYSVNTTGGPGFGEVTENGEKWYGNAGGSTFANTKIKWETTLTRNLAFDLGLFGDRLTITPEVYWNTTKDLLYKSDVPSTTGYTQQMQNIGQVTNKGFELTIGGDILRGKDYVLSGNLTLGSNKMKVDKLNDTDNVIWDQNDRWKSSYNDYCLKVGDQVGLIYGFVYDGLYGFDEFDFDPNQNFLAVPKEGTIINNVFNDSNSGKATLPGKIKFKDISGPNGKPDGQITEDDRTIIGNTNPKVQGGFGLSGQWKGIDFTANFNYMYDFDVNNATAYQLSSSESNSKNFFNVLTKFNNRWTYVREDGECLYKNTYLENSVELYKELNAGKTLWNPTDVTNKVTHSYFIEDGSFLRCQDITIGYTLPKQLTNKWGMSRLRFYVSGSNLFIITGYSGYDPEVDVQTGLTSGMDYNRYPRSRSFVFGANITF